MLRNFCKLNKSEKTYLNMEVSRDMICPCCAAIHMNQEIVVAIRIK